MKVRSVSEMALIALEYGGKTHPIHKTPFVLGRARDCDLVVFGDAVSRRHAALVEIRGEISIEDLGSRNGVLVNMRRIEGRLRVRPGDVLTLGDETVTVCTDRSAATKRPEATATRLARPSPTPLDPTAPIESLDLFASAVDKALLAGRIADAERLFALHLGRPLERAPRERDPGAEVIETVALVALR